MKCISGRDVRAFRALRAAVRRHTPSPAHPFKCRPKTLLDTEIGGLPYQKSNILENRAQWESLLSGIGTTLPKTQLSASCFSSCFWFRVYGFCLQGLVPSSSGSPSCKHSPPLRLPSEPLNISQSRLNKEKYHRPAVPGRRARPRAENGSRILQSLANCWEPLNCEQRISEAVYSGPLAV